MGDTRVPSDALAALVTALELNQGAAVFFAVTPPGEARAYWMRRLREALPHRSVMEVVVSPQQPLLLEELKARLSALPIREAPPVLFIDTRGLEWAEVDASGLSALDDEAAQARRVLQALNLQREALAKLEMPIVFWVTPEALRAFSRWAADLFAVNSGVFELARFIPHLQPSDWNQTWREGVGLPWLESEEERRLRNLPEEEIWGRIRLTEDQLERESRKPAPHRPLLAALHLELARLYRHIGQPASALLHLERARQLYQTLAWEQPQAALPLLATTLEMWAALLFDQGHVEEALQTIRESIDIRRKLAAQNPQAFRPDLARSLLGLSTILADLGRREEALQASQEAVDIYRQLAQQNPQAFRYDLGMSLINLANLTLYLPPHLRQRALADALQAARSIRDADARADALAALAPHLPPDLRQQALTEAFQAAQSIESGYARADALAALAPHLPPHLRPQALAAALQAARSIESDYARADALAALAPHLPPHLLPEALQTAQSIESDYARADALAALAPHLPPHLLLEALQVARSIRDADARAKALAALAPHLPPHLLPEGLQVIKRP